MKIYQKILLGFALFLLMFFVAIHVYSTFYLEDQIKNSLVNEINKNAEGKYEFNISSLNLNFINRTISLEEISFNTTESAVQQLNVGLNSISLSGIDLRQLLFKREISIGRIHIDSPSIQIRRDASESTGSNAETLIQRAAEASSSVLSNIVIPEITVTNFDLQLFRQTEQTPYLSFSNSELTLFDISLNEASLTDSYPFEHSSGAFQNINYYPESGLYSIRGVSAEFSSITQTASADSLFLNPLLEAPVFFDTVGYRTDRMTGSLTSVQLDGFDINTFLNSGVMKSENIFLHEPKLSMFRNKNYPRRENRSSKPLPQELLLELGIPVKMDVITIEDASVRYSEIAENSTESGYIEFTDLDSRLLNTTNIDSLIEKNSSWSMEANTRVMDNGELDVSFQFPLNEDYHTVTGRLKEMNAMDLNHALEPIASVRIESGNISSMRFEMRMDKTEAIGFLEVIYDDLKISVLDDETGDKNIRSRITSFLANQLKIKKENAADNPRMGAISYQREPEKSFFNYWWKSLRTGLSTSVGIED